MAKKREKNFILLAAMVLTFLFLRMVDSYLYRRSYPERPSYIQKKWDIKIYQDLVSRIKKRPEKEKRISPEMSPLLSCVRVKCPPRIDGKLDDLCWQKSQVATNFISPETKGLAEAKTSSYVAYDRKRLYFAFLCEEPYLNRVRMKEKRADGRVWRDDSLEILIDTNDDQKADYRFLTNIAGTKYDARINYLEEKEKVDRGWNSTWKVGVSQEKGAWSAEASIPFQELGIRRIKEEEGLRFNLIRHRYARREESLWSPQGLGGFLFRRSIFLGKVLPIEEEELDLNKGGDVRMEVENKTADAEDLMAEATLFSTTGSKVSFESKEMTIKREEKETVTLSYKIKNAGIHYLVLSLCSKEDKSVYYRLVLPVGLTKDAFITKWLLAGPFPNPGGRVSERGEGPFNPGCKGWNFDFLKELGGEKQIEPKAGMLCSTSFGQFQRYQPRWPGAWKLDYVKWFPYRSEEALIDLTKIFSPNTYVLAYAACYILSPQERDILVKLGSDDGYKLWFNHQLIASLHEHRGSAPDQNAHRVHLQKGINLLLLKVDQDFGGFNFYLRISDLKGRPLPDKNIICSIKK